MFTVICMRNNAPAIKWKNYHPSYLLPSKRFINNELNKAGLGHSEQRRKSILIHGHAQNREPLPSVNAVLIPLFMTQQAPSSIGISRSKQPRTVIRLVKSHFFAPGLYLISLTVYTLQIAKYSSLFLAKLGKAKIVYFIMLKQCSIVNSRSPKAMYVRMLGRELKE